MIEMVWAVCLTALLVFCFRWVYWAGYKRGARRVLHAWKKNLEEVGAIKNDER